jgi:folate-binding protein YgfZ
MAALPLHEFHQRQRAVFNEIAGQEVVLHYGDPTAEYHALTQSAALLDFSFRGRLCLLGSDREKFLHGQITNDLKRLRVGEGTYAALVNAKAKMEADLFVYKLKDELLLDFEPGLTSRISERLEKYIISEDVQIVDVSVNYGLLSVQGPGAAQVLKNSGLVPNPPDKSLSFVSFQENEADTYVLNQPRLGTSGFDLFVPAGLLQTFAERLAPHTTLAGWEAFEIARIQAGIPRFGQDMDETNLAPEAEMQDRGISYSKGCYIGQEIIARIRTYGQVAKGLRVLELRVDLPKLPPKGTKLFKENKEIGYITSAACPPASRVASGLGYVRKEANQIGSALHLGIPDGPTVKVLSLPCPPNPNPNPTPP